MALAAVLMTGPALANGKTIEPIEFVDSLDGNWTELADVGSGASGGVSISESEAADIAQSAMPGAKVLKVKLLPSGVYAVTLKEGGNVTRVNVNASTGAIE